MKSVLMDLSGVFADEGWDSVLASDPGNTILRLRDVEGTRGYCCPDAEDALMQAMASCPLDAIHWIDTGDYHYISALWLRKLEEPSALFLFDHHSDDQSPAFGGLLSCGSWMLEAKANPMVRDDAPSAYISIDLDWLSPAFARTDWDQGDATLQQLFDSLDEILSSHRLAGVDICGGLCLRDGAHASDFAVNLRTRRALLDYFAGRDL